jgi:hypothetical protein
MRWLQKAAHARIKGSNMLMLPEAHAQDRNLLCTYAVEFGTAVA